MHYHVAPMSPQDLLSTPFYGVQKFFFFLPNISPHKLLRPAKYKCPMFTKIHVNLEVARARTEDGANTNLLFDQDTVGFTHELAGQVQDIGWHSGREQCNLDLLGQELEDLIDLDKGTKRGVCGILLLTNTPQTPWQ